MPTEAQATFSLKVNRPELIAQCVRPSLSSNKVDIRNEDGELNVVIDSDSLSNLRGLTNSLLRLVKLGQKMDVAGS